MKTQFMTFRDQEAHAAFIERLDGDERIAALTNLDIEHRMYTPEAVVYEPSEEAFALLKEIAGEDLVAFCDDLVYAPRVSASH